MSDTESTSSSSDDKFKEMKGQGLCQQQGILLEKIEFGFYLSVYLFDNISGVLSDEVRYIGTDG